MELSSKEKNYVVFGLLLGLFLAAIEATVVATSMPTAAKALGGLSIIHYVFVSYQLATGITIVLWGKLADSLGLKKSYQVGLLLFLLGSALCGLSKNIEQLIVFRFIQGIGAGALYPISQTAFGALFTPVKRAKLQVYASLVWALASFMGPPLGALITEHFSWRWVFYINLPAGLVSLGLFMQGLSHYRDGRADPLKNLDLKGALIFAVAICLFILSVSVDKTGHFVFSVPALAVLFTSAFILLAAFAWHIKRASHPLLSPEIFSNPVFRKAGPGSFFMCMAMFGTITFIPLIAQLAFKESVLGAGRTLTIFILGWMSSSFASGKAYLKFKLSSISRTSLGLIFIVFGIFTLFGATMKLPSFQIWLFFLGLGMGIAFAPLLLGIQASLDRRELGSGTATFQLLRNLGGTFGVSILGTIFALSLKHNSQAYGLAGLRSFFLANALASFIALVILWNIPVPEKEESGSKT